MKIFVTNLETSPDRKRHIQNELLKTGLDYEFVTCVVGAELSDSEINQACDMDLINEYNKKVVWFTKGIIGCTLTNKNTYRAMVDQHIDYAFLLEDDMSLPANLKEILEHIESFIQQGDVILLYSLSHGNTVLRKAGINIPFEFNYYLPDNFNYLTSGSAFIVTRKAAEKMLAANTPVRFTPDDWEYFFKQGCIDRLLVVKPDIVTATEFRTTMETSRYKKIASMIEKGRVFPFYQVLKFRRRRLKKKMQRFVFHK